MDAPRAQYENEDDLVNESRVLEVISEKWLVSSHKLPISYGLDYALVRDGAITAYAEIKCRTNPKNKYPTYMVAAHKISRANDLFSASATKSFLVVGWQDVVGWCRLDGTWKDVRWGGRNDRADAADMEPMVHLDIALFVNF